MSELFELDWKEFANMTSWREMDEIYTCKFQRKYETFEDYYKASSSNDFIKDI